MLEILRQDVVFAVRSLTRSRGVTAVAILSLSIGIAANATIFSLVQALEFPNLIYPDASQIVVLESRNQPRGIAGMLLSVPDAMDVMASARTLDAAAVTADQSSVLHESAGARRISGRRVTAPFFSVLQVRPALGRTLSGSDQPGVIVLSDATWRAHFHADPHLVGRPIRLDGGLVTVVGVMPPRFDADAEFWTPFVPPLGSSRDDRQFTVFARLTPAASFRDAAQELVDLSRRLATEAPATNQDWEIYPVPLARLHGRDSRESFLLLQAAVGFVLLIACANIANILLARGASRQHEMAVRISLGAGRRRLLSSLLAESLTLAALGGALGLLLAFWGIRLARAIGGFPDVIEPTLNLTVLLFTAAVSMLTGVLSGIVPALRASAASPNMVLKSGDRTAAGRPGGRMRAGLVATQIALAVVLGTCGLLMVRSFVNRQQVDLGFEPRGALRGEIALPPERYGDPDAVRAAAASIVDALQRQSGVVAAGASTWALPTAAGAQRQLTVPGGAFTPLPLSIPRGVESVTPGYFSALGVPLRAGRGFTDGDGHGGAPVAIINGELAQRLWPGSSPVGETLRLGAPHEAAPVVTVVGVIDTVRRSAMHDRPVARVYLPYAQYPNGTFSIVVRTRQSGPAAARQIEAAVQQTDPLVLVEQLRTLDADVAQFLAPLRMMTVLLGAFGAAGVLLAALGIFGTMSYTVSQRQRELALRAALGATRRDIVRLVFGGAASITAAGMLLGGIGAAFAARFLAGFVFGVAANDPLTVGSIAALLGLVALASCYRPARRAASVDPLILLRE